MDKSIREKLKGIHPSNVNMDLEPILSYMESTGIEFRDRNLAGPMGIATFYCLYLDLDKMVRQFDTRMIAYVMLHELGHYKRISKMGKEHVLKMLSNHDFDSFSDHIIGEEIAADRYSTYVYLKLTGKVLNPQITQQLHLEHNRTRYRERTKQLFGIIDNDEEKYIQLLEGFIINQTKEKEI